MGEDSVLELEATSDALKAYRRTRLKLLVWAPSDEDGISDAIQEKGAPHDHLLDEPH